MSTQSVSKGILFLVQFFLAFSSNGFAHGVSGATEERKFVSIQARTPAERTRILEAGVQIDEIYSDRVWALITPYLAQKLKQLGIPVLSEAKIEVYERAQRYRQDLPRTTRSANQNQFPSGDEAFHNYDELIAEFKALEQAHPEYAKMYSLGKTLEGRDQVVLQINSSQKLGRGAAFSNKPGVVFLGAHHAREHLSVEVPLALAKYLLSQKNDPKIKALLNTRDIWIAPMVNPDGAEWDIQGGRYKMWRKNRRGNGSQVFGVDLNRNYGYLWGTGGSSSDPRSDTYRGPEAFSEPETQAIKNFIEMRPNIKTLLSFHTYSELILYPWGHTYDSITNEKDRKTHEVMAQTMAKWNGYTPQQSSDLYITSGDTTDWSYGTKGIYSFTFELTPRSAAQGGFYPGASVIDSTIRANLPACLFLIDLSDDPTRVLTQGAGSSIWYRR